TAAVAVNSATLTGAGFSISGATFPLTLNPNQTATLTVQFDPTTAGAAAGTLAVSSNSSTSSSATISLSGTGVPVLTALSCANSSMSGSGTDACTVTMNAAAASGGFTVNLTSSNSSVTVPASVTVAAGATSASFYATVSVVSTAQAATLTATAGSNSQTFALQLNASVSTLSISATSLSFGSVAVNFATAQSIILSSTGAAALTINSATLTGTGFSISGVTFPLTLNPNQTATLTVQFDPTAAGAATGQLVIASNSSTGASTSVTLSGTGMPVLTGLSCTNSSMTGAGTDACTVTLNSAAASSGFTVNLASNNSAVTVPASVPVAAGATTASFSATVTSVSTTQSATLTATAGANSQTFALQLNASVPTLTISATTMSFGSVAVNSATTQSLTLSSTGTASVTINSATLTGTGFSISGATFPLTLNPNETATLTVQFDPTTAGAATGSLTISSNSSTNGTAAVTLSGTGMPVLTALSCANSSITGAGTDACTVTLNAAAGSGGFTVNLASSNSAVTVPASIQVAAGATTASFSATVSAVSTAQVATLTATAGSNSQIFALQMTTATPTLRLSTSGSPSAYGSAVTFTATISSGPTGAVTFYGGTGSIGTGSINGTTATITTSSLVAGSHTVTAVWPGSSNYGTATSGAIIQIVNKATPPITWNASAAITYGTALSATQLSASSTVAGTFIYTPAAATVLKVGVQTLTVTFTPTDTADYITATATVNLAVNQATPAITWATPTAITYGTALSSTQLDATSTIPGTFVYSPAAGAVLAAGSQTLSVTFTPTDAADYTPATQTVILTVNPISSFVQETASATSASANSLALSFPASTFAGDLILVGFDFSAGITPSSVTDSQGNTFTQVGAQLASPAGAQSVVYYAKNIKGGADTVTVTLSAASAVIELYLTEYSGMDLTNPIDAQVGASGSAGPVSSGAATTNFAGDVIYGYCVADWACTAGSGFAARSTFNANLIEDQTSADLGSYAATGSASNGWTMHMVALKLASSGSAVPAPAITSAASASGTVGSGFSYQITATNTPTSYGAAGLPAGLTLNVGSGLISGTPTAAGSTTVPLSATNGAGTGNATLTLSIAAAVPTLSINATSLPFGDVTVNTPATQMVTLTSTGTAPVTVSAATLAGTGFSVSGAAFPLTLNPNQAMTLSVEFDPTTAGAATGQLTITSNSLTNPADVISLSGMGESNSGGSGTNSVNLTWDAPSASGVTIAGYNVYRTMNFSSAYQLLNSSADAQTAYVDNTVQNGQTYNYFVETVDSAGVSSAPSIVASVTIP
ncbi:MAG: choice-of-anchor D domain-containing protein, partial [Terracidiphilus sp.]